MPTSNWIAGAFFVVDSVGLLDGDSEGVLAGGGGDDGFDVLRRPDCPAIAVTNASSKGTTNRKLRPGRDAITRGILHPHFRKVHASRYRREPGFSLCLRVN